MAGVRRLLPERLRRPLRSPSFRRLVLGKSISYLGDWLMVAVLVGWVYESTSSVAQVALLMAVRLVPPIVGGGFAASLVDRLPRRSVLVWSEVACAATIAGALVGVIAGSRVVVFAVGGAVAGLGANLASYGIAVFLFGRIRVGDEGARESGRARGGLIEGLRY